MATRRAILERWKFPFVQHGGVTLVARDHARNCIERIFAEPCRFYGYDAFTVFPDNKIQPHLDWSASWPRGAAPTFQAVVSALASHPPEVTHYEFVFEDGI